MAREASDVSLRVLKGSSKSRFDSFSVRDSALIISYITFLDCRVHIFPDLYNTRMISDMLVLYNCAVVKVVFVVHLRIVSMSFVFSKT